MKKIISLLLTAVMLCALLTACGSKESFTVGFDASFPPYGYVDESGAYVGFDLDLAAEVCERRGWNIKLQPIDWDAKDMELSSGTIDCIWNGFTKSEERLNEYTWTDAYVDNSQVFVVAANSGIKTQADLTGKTVAVQAGSSALDALESEDCTELLASFKELLQVPDYNTAFMYLESGAVEAVAMDIGVAKYQIAVRTDGGFVILDEVLVSEEYAVGFLLGNTKLRDQVQETLYEMVKDGTFDEIAKKWDVQDSVVLGK